MLAEFERGAYAAGLMVFAASTADDVERERTVVLSMARRGFDGVVVEPIGPDHSYLAPEMAAGLAVVAVDRPVTGPADRRGPGGQRGGRAAWRTGSSPRTATRGSPTSATMSGSSPAGNARRRSGPA